MDQQGEIQIPLIGSVKVSGLPTVEIRERLRSQLLTYLNEPVVNIRILNFKISVFGDVLKPGVYDVNNERITIPEAENGLLVGTEPRTDIVVPIGYRELYVFWYALEEIADKLAALLQGGGRLYGRIHACKTDISNLT